MQPDKSRAPIWRIATKEITLFFASPIAWLFLACFAGFCLFVVFWGENFFARNISDVRPLFEWMPVLLIFLSSALTMRLWSEERRTETLEHITAQAVPLWQFVAGKFLACMILLCIAVLIILPLPFSVSVMGELDWGPVWAGLLATLLLGAAYLSIGLFVSAHSDNQIVSLILATLVCGAFYLLGTPMLTDLFSINIAEVLRNIGTGSRFDSITRGVIDLRDLYYYLSIVAIFLILNTWALERERWAHTGKHANHRAWNCLTLLLTANFFAANLWLGQISALRIDTTQGEQYSISDTTRNYLQQLQEPLLIRGYFSSKTHPLLAPLVPQLRDLMREYEIAGHGKVQLEFIDPLTAPELEKEANQKYGIQPVPFQVEDRYQSSIVSSYFNILVQYGDETSILGFNDLIEVRVRGEADIEVLLRNPEYDISLAIKRAMRSYRGGGNLFDTIQGTVEFQGFVSAEEFLPEKLRIYKRQVIDAVDEMKARSNGKLQVEFLEPEKDDGRVAQQILEQYGFRPMSANLFGDKPFYFYTILKRNDQVVQINIENLDETSFGRNLRAAIKRFDSGFARTVGLVTSDIDPAMMQQGMAGDEFRSLENFLSEERIVKREDLNSGTVSGDVDILVVSGAKDINETQLFAIDQFLMQGGTIIIATAPYTTSMSRNSLDLIPQDSGLTQWLEHHGLSMSKKLVMDPQNSKFPVPVNRNVGGFQIQEIRMLDYPWFVDIRSDGMDTSNPIVGELRQIIMPWAVPIVTTNAETQGNRETFSLIHSSTGSWLSESKNIMPTLDTEGKSYYPTEGETAAHALAVISSGVFDSWFAGKSSPLLSQPKDTETSDEAASEETENEAEEEEFNVSSVIDKSRESARIILFSSSDMLRDQIIQFLSTSKGSNYLNNFQLISNAIDWSLEDSGLLGIRSRGQFNRTLPPMEHGEQLFWEYLNYALAALMLGLVALINYLFIRRKRQHYATVLRNEPRSNPT